MEIEFKPDVIIQKHSAILRSTNEVRLPETLDLRDLVLKTEDQGSTPQCAAYTGTSWLEAVNWRRTGKPDNLNPQELYSMAKTLDGHPEEQGTTMEAIMKGMIRLGWTNKTDADIRFFTDKEGLKQAIHRYGTALLAFDICSQWQIHSGLDMKKSIGDPLGGHAVTCCGYDRTGVFIQNSWGLIWGKLGFARISWKVFEKEFREGAYYVNVLDNMEE